MSVRIKNFLLRATFAFVVHASVAFAQEPPPVLQKIDILPVREVESRIIPIESQKRYFKRTWIGLGLSLERPVMRTHQNYRSAQLGMAITFDQMVSDSWSGGLWLQWGEWRGEKLKVAEKEAQIAAGNVQANGPAATISPLTLVSSVNYFLPVGAWHPPTGKYFRPFLGAGLGWLQFLKQLNLKATKSKEESSEPILSVDAGFKVIVSESFAMRLVFERWRGLNTYDFVANRVMFQLLMGDFGEANGT